MSRNKGGRYTAKDTDATPVQVEAATGSDPRGDRARDEKGKATSRKERALTNTESAALADRAAPRTGVAGDNASSPAASSSTKTKSTKPKLAAGRK
ncbi:hypothetical protein BN1012_Phect2596 [Candidatus Phaeomarinobacter ectocarpi]|uniref:Uncharacterized protein n=1 Tax=Candidatus Phaeomarinibacter ectocarpi TaxID=1458461 RepID=X5MGW7_9HYPH|nr:hypothetical protein [Candidatus Phaeomarinobacter ectocarpi]CDO60809.1 hypothetical protein BN1012_Phect2596 [Candidatus Phaeomarinobacter ectocarpi]